MLAFIEVFLDGLLQIGYMEHYKVKIKANFLQRCNPILFISTNKYDSFVRWGHAQPNMQSPHGPFNYTLFFSRIRLYKIKLLMLT